MSSIYLHPFVILWLLFTSFTLFVIISAYVCPKAAGKFMSTPFAFEFHMNSDLDMQSALYAIFHITGAGNVSHMHFVLDVFIWFYVLRYISPWLSFAILVPISVQCYEYSEPKFSHLLFLVHIAFWYATWCIPENVDLFIYGCGALVVFPWVCVIGHAFEPIPPLVGEHTAHFNGVLGISGWKAVFSFLGGLTCEFASAIPGRLCNVQIYWIFLQLGYAPQNTRTWKEFVELSNAVHEHGWHAYPKVYSILMSHKMIARKSWDDLETKIGVSKAIRGPTAHICEQKFGLTFGGEVCPDEDEITRDEFVDLVFSMPDEMYQKILSLYLSRDKKRQPESGASLEVLNINMASISDSNIDE